MIYTHQLPESPPPFVVLHCPACGDDYSANRGDYFMLPPDMPHKCICGGILFIVTRKTTSMATAFVKGLGRCTG